MAAAWAAEAETEGQHLDTSFVPLIFGPLWYDHQDLLRPRDAGTRDSGIPNPKQPTPGPARPAPKPNSALPGARCSTPRSQHGGC